MESDATKPGNHFFPICKCNKNPSFYNVNARKDSNNQLKVYFCRIET